MYFLCLELLVQVGKKSINQINNIPPCLKLCSFKLEGIVSYPKS